MMKALRKLPLNGDFRDPTDCPLRQTARRAACASELPGLPETQRRPGCQEPCVPTCSRGCSAGGGGGGGGLLPPWGAWGTALPQTGPHTAEDHP